MLKVVGSESGAGRGERALPDRRDRPRGSARGGAGNRGRRPFHWPMSATRSQRKRMMPPGCPPRASRDCPTNRRRTIAPSSSGASLLRAIASRYRESAESWKTVLRDLKRRGMHSLVVVVGDGALGFWAAVREVWSKMRAPLLGGEPRDRVAGVRAGLGVRHFVKRRLRARLEPVSGACRECCRACGTNPRAKYPKAVTALERRADTLDAEHICPQRAFAAGAC